MMYIPPDVPLRTIDDLSSWPLLGRVGFCLAGEDIDSMYVYLHETFPESFALWTQWESLGRRSQTPYPAEGMDMSAETLMEFLSRNVVVWCPPELDDLVERRVLNLRSDLRRIRLRQGRLKDVLALYCPGRPSADARPSRRRAASGNRPAARRRGR